MHCRAPLLSCQDAVPQIQPAWQDVVPARTASEPHGSDRQKQRVPPYLLDAVLGVHRLKQAWRAALTPVRLIVPGAAQHLPGLSLSSALGQHSSTTKGS